jgi:outer membrane protein assembly factor BamE (lipoprotein component of BamABCDE complex)
MKRFTVLLVGGALLLSACASAALNQDCLKRKAKVEQVAALANSKLQVGFTAQEVRAALGEPDEIIGVKGSGGLVAWKYYLYQNCRARLGMIAPETELIFLDNRLVKWSSHVR